MELIQLRHEWNSPFRAPSMQDTGKKMAQGDQQDDNRRHGCQIGQCAGRQLCIVGILYLSVEGPLCSKWGIKYPELATTTQVVVLHQWKLTHTSWRGESCSLFLRGLLWGLITGALLVRHSSGRSVPFGDKLGGPLRIDNNMESH